MCSSIDFLKHSAQDFCGVFRRLALDTEALHGLGVPFHVVALIQVERTRQLLHVDHIRKVDLREPENRERTTFGGVATRAEWHYLECDVGFFGRLDQRLELCPHHLPATNRTPERRLIHHCPQPRSPWFAEQFLPGNPQAYPALDFLGGSTGLAER